MLHREFQGRKDAGNRLKTRKDRSYGLQALSNVVLYRREEVRGSRCGMGCGVRMCQNQTVGFTRRQRNVKLGPVSELTNKAMALERLSVLMNQKPTTQLNFGELFERWKAAVVPHHQRKHFGHLHLQPEVVHRSAFGSRQVSEISRYEVETFLLRIGEEFLSQYSARNEGLARSCPFVGQRRWHCGLD